MSRARTGFSLVEVLVASGVLVAVILPIYTVFTQSIRQTEISFDEIVATNLAEEIADQIQVVPQVAGFLRFPSYPFPNPPPAYPEWREYKCTGMTLPPARPGLLKEIDTRSFTLTGTPYPQDDTPPPFAAYLRLYLSPLPDRFTRKVKVHRVTNAPHSDMEDPNMVQVESLVEWEDRALAGPHTKRQVSIKAIVSNPTLGWGGF